MRKLAHPNLLGLLGVSASAESLSMLMEYLPRGSVYT